jgi:hypothetical protein
MRQPLLSARPCVTRTSRRDPRGAQLESVAAEFALLAQRRARLARQLDLLGRQLDAAHVSLHAVQSRMGLLAMRMDHIDPNLRAAAELPIEVPQPLPVQRVAPAPARPTYAQAPAPSPPDYPQARFQPPLGRLRQVPRRRPFLPE